MVLACPVLCLSQDSSKVRWHVWLQPIDTAHFVLHANASINNGWWLYENNMVNGVEGVSFKWSSENLILDGKMETNVQPKEIKDNVFSAMMMVFKENVHFSQPVKVIGKLPKKISIQVNGFIGDGQSFVPIDYSVILGLQQEATGVQNNKAVLANVDIANPAANCGKQVAVEKGLLAIFFLGMLGGLIALFTPCVFPMIPVTVGYFTNALREPQDDNPSGQRNTLRQAQGDNAARRTGITKALLYGLFILLVYLLASVPFHLMGNINPQIFNTISTNAWVNIVFFLVFVAFALSFFGVFNMSLPSWVANKTNDKAGMHIGGIFFMALTLAIVSFSCTGPILGSLLVSSISSDKGAWQLTAGMGGFGLALALPFALFAMFPNWMGKLPKSGGWLNTVKVTLAFVELALALKFLSNADLVKHWGILKREVFIGLWIVIALCLALYLLDIKGKGLSRGRFAFGILVLLFALYLTPGLTQTKYANLKLLSGFPPPLSYSIYGKDNVKGKALEPDVINDYAKALQLSKEQHKPILIDFTGWACVNCRKMEEQVWTKPEISAAIKEKFILVSLYVDDRQKLKPEEQFIHGNKEVLTVGDLYALMERENFKQVTQPLYVILDSEERLLNHPVGYTPNVGEYRKWLDCGAAAFNK